MARRHRWLIAVSFGALAAACGATPGIAQQKAPAPAAAKQNEGEAKAKAVAAAQKAYENGTKAFEAGKFKDATGLLSSALSGGGLPAPQMAKALYYRGVAYRKQNKPAQAMSDLTTAVWVSGGLSEQDRAQAIEERAAAYREAGLGEAAPIVAKPDAVASTAKAAPAAPAANPPAAAPAVQTAEVAPAAAPAQQAIDLAPAPAQAAAPSAKYAQPTSVWQGNPFDSSPQAQPASAAPAAAAAAEAAPPPPAPPEAGPAPAAAVAPAVEPQLSAVPPPGQATQETSSEPSVLAQAGQSITQAGNNIGNFFGNLFNGSSGNASATAQPAPAQQQVANAPEALTSSTPVLTASSPNGDPVAQWGDATQVKSGSSKTEVAAIPAPAANPGISTGAIAPAQAAPVLKGKYKLQVGAVRTRAEAEGLAQKLASEHGAGLGGRAPLIDEAVIGNFGTFYRVRVGPYANTAEPNKLCTAIRPNGFDCLVVTQ